MEIGYNNYKEHPYAGSQSNLINKALEKKQYIQEQNKQKYMQKNFSFAII